MIAVMAMWLLASCSNNSSATSPGTQVVLPLITVVNTSRSEGNSRGITNLNFSVTLNKVFFRDVSVSYATADNTALAGSDYVATSGTLIIPAGSTTGTITVMVNADLVFESNELFILTLSNAVNGLLVRSTVTGTILNDDAAGLNDTGISLWGDLANNNLTVIQPLFPVQDADVGRDVLMSPNRNADGRLGFSFTKLDATGEPLVKQSAIYTATPWDCVLDQTTGLMWEVKTPNLLPVGGIQGLRDAVHTYSWYNSSGVNDGGDPGTPNGGVCVDVVNCDTQKYVAAVNQAGLCGYSDWRLPTVAELGSIVDFSVAYPGPAIDTGFFPNTVGPSTNGQEYWSSTPDAGNTTFAWNVNFGNSIDVDFVKSRRLHIRLVRKF